MTCTRPLSITVTPVSQGPYYWWKMEEAGSSNRVDSIAGVVLVPLVFQAGTSFGNGPGIINDGAVLAVLGGAGVNPHADRALDSNDIAAFAFAAGAGFTMTAWVNFDPTGTRSDAWHLSMVYGAFNVSISIAMTGTPGVYELILTDIAHAPLTMTPMPTDSAWHFFRLWYDEAAGLLWGQMDNGTKFSKSVGSVGSKATGELVLEAETSRGTDFGNVDWNVTFDEVGWWPKVLTDAQATYLYNGGAGRTSPIVLP